MWFMCTSPPFGTSTYVETDSICCRSLFCESVLLSTTPRPIGNHQTVGGLIQLHGNHTPPRISPSCLHLLRRITFQIPLQRSTSWPDRRIIVPIAGHGDAQIRCALAADKNRYSVFLGCHGVSAASLPLLAEAMGMYLMNDMNMSRYQLEAKVRQQAKGIWAPLLTTSLTRNIVTLKIKFSSYFLCLQYISLEPPLPSLKAGDLQSHITEQ